MDEFVRKPKKRPLQLEVAAVASTGGSNPIIQAPNSSPVDVPKQAPEDQPSAPKKPKKKFNFNPKNFKLPVPKTKLQWIIFGVVAFLLLALSASAIYWFIIRDTSPPPVVYVEPEPEPEPPATTGPSRMSGREVALDAVSKPAYAVQIENSPEARPQSGLRDADIVSEAVAEGGITRFNAIFHDNVPANIGPVRSLRPYYIDWFLPYGAPIVHAGGSAEALADIKSIPLQDIDNVSGYFRRVSNRYSPHNLYTTGPQILELFSNRGYKNSDFTGLPRKVAAPSAAPDAGTINLKISSALYNVTFNYDKATNKYLRSQGGGAHKDADTGEQISPDVVVVPVLSKKIHPDRVHTQYGTIGSGEVFVFQDGTVTKGTWSKASRDAQWKLTDATGADIKLNPGQTWFTMIDAAGSVSVAP